jgi:hypothetical protein
MQQLEWKGYYCRNGRKMSCLVDSSFLEFTEFFKIIVFLTTIRYPWVSCSLTHGKKKERKEL